MSRALVFPVSRYRSAAMHLPPEWRVPQFEVSEYAPKRSLYCVVVPVINEGERVLRQLAAMGAADLGIDIVVADGGSDDGSMEDSKLALRGVRARLVKLGPGRLSAQLRMAFAWAIARGYAGVITIDGNGKDGWDAIPLFVARLKAGFDFVQGSRYLPGGRAINTPLDRHIAVRWMHAPLVSWAAGFRYTDTTNGFRAFSARLLRDPRVAPFRDVFSAYELHYYLAVQAPRLGYRVGEVPVSRSYPPQGQTPTKISGIGGRLRILQQLFGVLLGRYRPHEVP